MTPDDKKKLIQIAEVADEGDFALLKYINDIEATFTSELKTLKDDFSKYAKESDLTDLENLVKDEFNQIKDIIQKDSADNEYINNKIRTIEGSINSMRQSIGQEYMSEIRKVFNEINTIKDRMNVPVAPLPPVDLTHIDNQISSMELFMKSLPTTQMIEERLSQYTPKVVEGLLQNILDLEKKIKELEKQNDRFKTWPVGGGSSGIKAITAGTGVSVDNTDPNYPILTAAGGLTTLTATGTVNDTNRIFTFTSKPTLICVNGSMYAENAGWTWVSLTLTATLNATNPGAVGTGGFIYGIK